jgi:hypothetical protein
VVVLVKSKREAKKMKLYVFTNDKGEVIGTALSQQEQSPNIPFFVPVSQPGHTIHELEVPEQVIDLRTTSLGNFHQELAKLIKTE